VTVEWQRENTGIAWIGSKLRDGSRGSAKGRWPLSGLFEKFCLGAIRLSMSRIVASMNAPEIWRRLAGYEAIHIHMIRNGQTFGRSAEGKAVQLHAFIASIFGFQV
jgi:hypothetical protein